MFACFLIHLAAELLNLINQEIQHHQHGHNRAQILISMTVIMLKMIPLILKGIDRFVLDSPPGTSGTHNWVSIFFRNIELSDPAKILLFARLFRFPIFQYTDSTIMVGVVQGNITVVSKFTPSLQ